MARRIAVEIVGDSRSVERAFARSSRSAQKFDRSIAGTSKNITRRFSTLQAGIVSGGIALALRDTVQVAAEAQQVLGQTSVAVESAGLSWKQYGDQIQQAIQVQSKFGFDDEALLRSFSLFVRNAGDVDEALRRNQIAMDLSRARFISLEQAASLVNKAALGNAGALRRVGIDARKGASGVELLAQLERQFGGAAEAASDDAATSMERLQVQVENAKESLGTLALPVVSNLATKLGEAAEGAQALTDKLQKLGQIRIPEIRIPFREAKVGGQDLGSIVGDAIRDGAKRSLSQIAPGTGIIDALSPLVDGADKAGSEAGRRAGDNFRVALREHLDVMKRNIEDTTKTKGRGVPADQRNTWWDAMIGRREDRVQDIRSLKGQLAELQSIAQKIRERISATDDPTRRLTLGDRLVGVLREQRSVQEEIAQKSRDAVQAEKDRLQAIKAANQALKDRAEAIKSAVLDRLQQRQTQVLNQRALRDAKERLRIARQIGTGLGIRQAREGLADVNMDILRARLEGAPARLTRGGQFALGNIVTINIHGVTDPNQVAIKVDEILKKRGRRSTTQTRGAAAGARTGAH